MFVSAILEDVIRQDVVQALPAVLASVIRMVLTTQHAALGIALKLGQRVRLVGLGIAAKKGPRVRQLVMRAFVTHHHQHAQDQTRTLLLPLKMFASAVLEDVIRQDVVQGLPAVLASVIRMVLTTQHAALGIALKLGQRVRLVGLGIAAKKGPRDRQLVERAFVKEKHAADLRQVQLSPSLLPPRLRFLELLLLLLNCFWYLNFETQQV